MSTVTRISALLLLLLFFSVAHAQQEGEAYKRLLSARTLRCELTQGVQASWESGEVTVRETRSGEDGKVTFDSIDYAQRTARLLTATGAGDVTVIYSPAGVTFVERTAVGNWNFTTVFANYQMPGSDSFIVVESRHITSLLPVTSESRNIVLPVPIPSQNYGTCVVLAQRQPAQTEVDENAVLRRFADEISRVLGKSVSERDYPRLAKQQNWQGTTEVRLQIGSDGKVKDVVVGRTSGYALLDQRAIELVRQLHLPKIPSAFRQRDFTVTVPVTFSLSNS